MEIKIKTDSGTAVQPFSVGTELTGEDGIIVYLYCYTCSKYLKSCDYVIAEVTTGKAFCSDACVDIYKVLRVTQKLDGKNDTGTATDAK